MGKITKHFTMANYWLLLAGISCIMMMFPGRWTDYMLVYWLCSYVCIRWNMHYATRTYSWPFHNLKELQWGTLLIAFQILASVLIIVGHHRQLLSTI